MRRLRQLLAGSRPVLANSASLVGTTAVTSLLGAAFWWVAARQFDRAAVGLAGAAISATTLISMLANSGPETLLIAEVAKGESGRAQRLVVTMSLVVAPLAGALGLIFAVVAPLVSSSYGHIFGGPASVGLFVIGVGVMAVAGLVDSALVGGLRGGVQLGRNTLFGIVKLAVLPLLAFATLRAFGSTIYTAFVAGNLASLIVVAAYLLRGSHDRAAVAARPEAGVLRGLGRLALGHHALNLGLRLPSLALPIVVVGALSASANAVFYVAFMIAAVIFVLPSSLSTVLYAVGAVQPAVLAQKLRLTVGVSLAAALSANAALVVVAPELMRLFGSAYAHQGADTVRLLGLAAFPLAVKNHYTAVSRIRGQVGRAAMLIWAGTTLEVVFAVAGAKIGGLNGVAIGWLVALCLEAAVMTPRVVAAAAVRADHQHPPAAGRPGVQVTAP